MSMIDRNKAIAFDLIRSAVLPNVACPAPADVVRAVRQMKRKLDAPRPLAKFKAK